MCKNCPYSEFFGPYSVRIRENTDQKKSFKSSRLVFQIILRSLIFRICLYCFQNNFIDTGTWTILNGKDVNAKLLYSANSNGYLAVNDGKVMLTKVRE